MLSKEEEVEVIVNSILNGDDTPVAQQQKENNTASLVLLRAILDGEDSPKKFQLSLSPVQNGTDDYSREVQVVNDEENNCNTKREGSNNKNASRKLVDFLPTSSLTSSLTSSTPSSSKSSRRISLRRKRRRLTNQMQQEQQTDYNDYQKFKKQNHSLYLSASNVAAMVGLHPYSMLPKLCMDLVYQGQTGRALLQHDAKLLHISLVDEVESLRQIAIKGGRDVKKALEKAIDIGKGKENIASVQNASQIKKIIVGKVQESKNLSMGEIRLLVEGVRHNVNTGFGKAHEENALDLYEKQCGWEVTERNAERRTWKFMKAEDATFDATFECEHHMQGSSKTVVPMDEETITTTQREHHREEEEDDEKYLENNSSATLKPVDKTGVTDVSVSKNEVESKPFFSINGMIDGIRDELYHIPSAFNLKSGSGITCHELHPQHMDLNYSDDDEWALRKVVVECKHRMNKAFDPPPIYDQIQAVIYAFMHGTSEAELVQVVRNESHLETETDSGRGRNDKNKDSDKSENSKTFTSVKITASRISLDDPVMRHRENWYKTVLPRLRTFVDAVYAIRRDDDKRYRMLCAAAAASTGDDDSEWWHLLHDECPFLINCDTAFSRKERRY